VGVEGVRLDKGGTVTAGDYTTLYGEGEENNQLETDFVVLYTKEYYQQLRE
jgi:hypothetical protein